MIKLFLSGHKDSIFVVLVSWPKHSTIPALNNNSLPSEKVYVNQLVFEVVHLH